MYDATVGGKSAFCSCCEHEVAHGNERKDMRLIWLASGIFGFDLARKMSIEDPDDDRRIRC